MKKIKWDKVKGEMVLTNKRILVLGEKGRLRKQVVPYLDIELGLIKAVSTSKSLTGKGKISLSTDLGTGKLETTYSFQERCSACFYDEEDSCSEGCDC